MLSFDSELITKIMAALTEKTINLNKMCDYEKLKDIFVAGFNIHFHNMQASAICCHFNILFASV